MTVRAFADTNVVVYSESEDGQNDQRAQSILDASPIISTQVVNETIVTLIRKFGFRRSDAHEVATGLMKACEVVSVEASTVHDAMRLAERHQISHWDALIVAAALEAKCEILYSEDLQHGQVFDDRLTVQDPFA